MTVTVTDNKDGSLTATVDEDTDAAFDNTYKVGSVSVDPPVQKVISNNDDLYNKGDFTFTIENTAAPEGVKAPMPAKTEIKNQPSDELPSKKGFYEFGEITFTEPGTYTYKVTESGSAPGVENDKTPTDEFTFTVTDDHNGALVVTPTTDEATFQFTNVYSAKGSITLKAAKELVGRDWMKDETFTFELYDEKGVKIDEKKADANETVEFDAIDYELTDVGTHTYTIKEAGPMPANVTNSGDITATVTVTDKKDGTLGTSVEYTNDDKIINTYVPKPTKAKIDVNKTIAGYLKDDDEKNADATFKFELFDEEGTKIDEISITTKDGKGSASFNEIEYKKAETHNYTVKETVESKKGFTYDENTYDVTVDVIDHPDTGELSAEISYKKNNVDETKIEFENTFKMTSAKVDLKLDKEIDDQSDSAHDSKFEFTLYKDSVSDENIVASETIETKNLKGSVTFKGLEFKEAGEYKYIVVEKDTGESGFKYDTEQHEYKIIVDNNFETAVLDVNKDSTLEAKIVNVYKAKETETVIKAEKKINDTSGSAYDTEFTFTLKDSEGKTVDTKSITGAGTVEFDSIKYEKAGTYNYTIQETAGDAKGYSYDDTEYKVKVTVEDKDGQLVATAVYVDKEGTEKTDLTITNTYDPEDAKITLEAMKVIDDKSGGASGKTFKFELVENGKVIDTVTRTGGGPVKFKELTYDKAGTYKYKIREVKGSDKGYTYDTEAKEVEVEVTDPDKNGALVAKVTKGSDITITNTYAAEPVKVTIKANKVLEGGKLKKGEFTFQLLQDGELITETINNADGSIDFSAITFDKAGIYNYTVVEVAGDDEDVTYDENEYSITVTVTDDGSGQLQAKVSGEPTFTNSIETTPPKKPKKPNTGDNGYGASLLVLLGAGAGFAALAARRRKRDEE